MIVSQLPVIYYFKSLCLCACVHFKVNFIAMTAASATSVHQEEQNEAEDEDEEETRKKELQQPKLMIEDDGHVDENAAEEGDEEVEGEERKRTIFDVLDAPRDLPEPVDLTLEHLKQISNELGLIQLCWKDDKQDAEFEGRTNFPESYTQNSMKERLLLLCAENFRKQFCHKYPYRKPLFLASDNECGVQKMVCTTLRPTTLSYTEIDTWQTCSTFVSDYLKYEPLKIPILFVSYLIRYHTKVYKKGIIEISPGETKRIYDLLLQMNRTPRKIN